MEYQSCGDGLGAWLKLQEDFDFGGSRKEWSDTLEDKLRSPYYMSEHKTVIDYLDSFQADMSECVGLGIISCDDVAKRKLLCDNLLGLEELGNTLDDCEEKNMTFLLLLFSRLINFLVSRSQNLRIPCMSLRHAFAYYYVYMSNIMST